MPLEQMSSFLVAICFVFTLSGILMLFNTKSSSSGVPDEDPEPEASEQPYPIEELEELVDEIERDQALQVSLAPVKVPHIDLPGALSGGGVKEEACSKVSGVISLKAGENPDERRQYNRRLSDRRSLDVAVDDDRRIVDRRIWLRRREDFQGKQLLTVTDAADTLGIPIEQLYRWLDGTDIPFYQVTDGKKKAIRFEINELLQWYGEFSSSGGQ